MSDLVICLGCGGMVDEGGPVPEGETVCRCPPPSRPASRDPVATGPCPRCRGALARRRYADLEADECTSCGGLMVTQATMDRIVAERSAATGLRLALPKRERAREDAVAYVRCPGCDKAMNRRAFGQVSRVIVDVCREHGVWFDAGELGAVLAFIEGGGMDRARARESAARDEERKKLGAQRAAMGATPMPVSTTWDATDVVDVIGIFASFWD